MDWTEICNTIPSDIGCIECPVREACDTLGKMHLVDIAHGCRGNSTCLELWKRHNAGAGISVDEVYDFITKDYKKV